MSCKIIGSIKRKRHTCIGILLEANNKVWKKKREFERSRVKLEVEYKEYIAIKINY